MRTGGEQKDIGLKCLFDIIENVMADPWSGSAVPDI